MQDHDVFKRRLNAAGQPIDEGQKHKVGFLGLRKPLRPHTRIIKALTVSMHYANNACC